MAANEIRTIMAALTKDHILLPNTVVAEVLSFTAPEPFKDAPAWLLGELTWRGWQVPVISYLSLLDEPADNAITSQARILIIKTLGESSQVNFIGLVIQGLPRLKTVTARILRERQSDGLPEALFSKVIIDEQTALIPELGKLTHIVEQTAYGN